jgi:phosphopantothenoylcysteine decarboxylase/phosphopantothenate--cysteine ligase
VTLVSGPTALPRPPACSRVDVETAREMLAACEAALPADIAVCVAAVADWRPESRTAARSRRARRPPPIAWWRTPTSWRRLSKAARRGRSW